MNKKAFTLIELVAVLVILAIVSLIVAPLILNTISNVKNNANKRSVDGYGRAVEYAMANYQLKHLSYTDDFSKLDIEYTGSKVECDISRINPDYSIYLSECKVNGKLVLDDKNRDGYYHYGILKMTNIEYVDAYGKNLEKALKDYYEEYNEYPSDYTTLVLEELDKEVSCDVTINCDGTVKLTSCKVNDEDVYEENTTDYYLYGDIPLATTCLLLKTNSKSITTYTDGNTHEMYTFEHEETEQTPALTDYRYIGNDPYNYVNFNGETWRIVGVFDTDDGTGKYERRIKIVRNSGDIVEWDWKPNNNPSYENEWTTATLQIYLNGNYYNSLDIQSKTLIEEIKYYLGSMNGSEISTENSYNNERDILVYSGHSTSWIGKIGLLYPSDYFYTFALGVDDICYNRGSYCWSNRGGIPSSSWMYFTNGLGWLITSNANNNHSFFIHRDGSLSIQRCNASLDYYPTLYLKTNAKIKSGNGTIDSPYEFEL